MSRISRPMSWPLIHSAEPTTRMSTPSPPDELGGLAVDPAVDVDLAAERLVAQQVARRAAASSCATSFMNDWPPKPGFDGHDHDDVEQLAYGSRRRQRRPRLDRQPGRPAGRPDRAQRRLDRLLDLDVERDRVAAGVEVLVEEAARLVDHQVGVERQLGPPAQVP